MMTFAAFAPYRTAAVPDADTVLSGRDLHVPYTGQTRARLLVSAGISDLLLRVDPSETALVRGHFDGPVPRVLATGDEVSIRYRYGIGDWLGGLFTGEHLAAALVLHPGVAWELAFRGGFSEVDADLRHGHVTSLGVSGGACELVLSLPPPDGVVPIRFRGGASEIAIRRPAGVSVGVQIRGGVSALDLDGRRISAAGGDISLESDGWSAASARYDVQITGGASDVSVST
jgi:hypothetical protein